MSSQSPILVLGAGELGLALLHSLKAHPAATHTPIHVLLRSPSSSSSLSPEKAAQLSALHALNVPVVNADLVHDSEDVLAAAFKPFGTVISCTGFIAGRGTQLKIARAVLAAGVARYFPWQFGVDYDIIGKGSAQDLFDEQLEVREMLRSQTATEWVIVSTGMFMSFLFEAWFGVVDLDAWEEGGGKRTRRVRALGGWGNEVTVTRVEDIGRVTAEIVFVEPRVANEVVFTAGETVSYGKVADVVEGVLGEKVLREVWDVKYLEKELAKDPNDAIKKYRVVFAKGKGVAWELGATFNAQKCIEVVGVEQWVRENLKK